MIFLGLMLILHSPPYLSIEPTNVLMFFVLLYIIGNAVDEIRQVSQLIN